MIDSQDKRADDPQDPRIINIEIPARCIEGMFRMMAARRDIGRAGQGCCGSPQDRFRPSSMEADGREFKIVIKMKE